MVWYEPYRTIPYYMMVYFVCMVYGSGMVWYHTIQQYGTGTGTIRMVQIIIRRIDDVIFGPAADKK